MAEASKTPRIVTPQEAQRYLDRDEPRGDWSLDDLAHTVATEPDRTRAAVVEALRAWAQEQEQPARTRTHRRADAIENGANW